MGAQPCRGLRGRPATHHRMSAHVKPRIATHFAYPLEPAKGLGASCGAASRILSPERGPIDPMTAACLAEKGESHATTAKSSSGIVGFAVPFGVLCLLNALTMRRCRGRRPRR